MIAPLARRNNVLPRVLTALATRYHMVQRQLRASLPTVLARISIPLKNLPPGELTTMQRLPNHIHKANHLGTLEHARHGVNVFDTVLNRFGFAFAK